MLTPVTVVFVPDPPDFGRQAEERARLEAEVRPINKSMLFDVLERLDVAIVVVGFDGSGDSGQIESITATRADGSEVVSPDETVPIWRVRWDAVSPETSDLPLAEAIETLAYDFLESVHDGWENNEGAFGEFTFDTDDRTIRLEYNERYETSDLHEHAF